MNDRNDFQQFLQFFLKVLLLWKQLISFQKVTEKKKNRKIKIKKKIENDNNNYRIYILVSVFTIILGISKLNKLVGFSFIHCFNVSL